MSESANIARHLPLMAARQPEQPAIKIPRGRTPDGRIDYLVLSFRELDGEVDAWCDHLRGKGVGRGLVEWTVSEVRRLGIRRLFALTYEQGFFGKLGFEVVTKDSLPLKVWSDCVRCPKRDGCDEIAVILVLADVEAPLVPSAPPTPHGVSIPVLDSVED